MQQKFLSIQSYLWILELLCNFVWLLRSKSWRNQSNHHSFLCTMDNPNLLLKNLTPSCWCRSHSSAIWASFIENPWWPILKKKCPNFYYLPSKSVENTMTTKASAKASLEFDRAQRASHFRAVLGGTPALFFAALRFRPLSGVAQSTKAAKAKETYEMRSLLSRIQRERSSRRINVGIFYSFRSILTRFDTVCVNWLNLGHVLSTKLFKSKENVNYFIITAVKKSESTTMHTLGR